MLLALESDQEREPQGDREAEQLRKQVLKQGVDVGQLYVMTRLFFLGLESPADCCGLRRASDSKPRKR